MARLNSLCDSIAHRTQLSTTGYQTAMLRLRNRDKSDTQSVMTLSRAEQYIDSAKKAFPDSTLKSLAELQQGINDDGNGGLVLPIEMSSEQLGSSLQRCRELGFSNCDMQALEVGLHLKHSLGTSDFKIYSNSAMSHNYVVIDPSEHFPKGAIVDPWTGQGVQELSIMNKLKLKHNDQNTTVNQNMLDFIDTYGASFVEKSTD